MAKRIVFAALLGAAFLLLLPPQNADGQLLPFAWRARPKYLYRYGYVNGARRPDPYGEGGLLGYYAALGKPPNPTAENVEGPEKQARIRVRLPVPNARVWFDRADTTQQGSERLFESPPLQSGFRYSYEIRVRWRHHGQDVEQTQTVTVQAGQDVIVEFMDGATAGR